MITTPGKVRDVMGTDKELAIDDEQLITIIGIAEKRIRRELFTFKCGITPSNDPDTGASWNGTNTSFTVGDFVMDYDFDESTSDDVVGKWWDSNDSPHDATVVVSNARYGRLTITQSDGSTPIPASATKLMVDYYSSDEDIPFDAMEEMGTLLASHYVTMRLTEPKKISLADLESNKRILEIRNNQFVNEYRNIMREYSEPMLVGVP